MAESHSDLVVRAESVQSLYGDFRSGRLIVNRRYQRKLVWSVEEKQSFIDSLLRGLPVPLILVAEVDEGSGRQLEIIDGLQRLNAIFGFLENEFPHEGQFFDLEALAETKQLKDDSELTQELEVLSRKRSVQLSGYALPVSVYRSETTSQVEDVFRRINSGGRHLSRQEIRQAGCLSNFADLVRTVSSGIRGDFSVSDEINLKDMPEISISSTAGGPGVFVEDVFWVRHNILDREQVRMSRDEEVVADLITSMVVEPRPPYDSRALDEFYGMSDGDARSDRIEVAILKYSPEEVQARFDAVLAVFEEIFDSDHEFSSHFFKKSRQRVPRYFESVFLGIDQVLSVEQLDLIDIDAVRGTLEKFGTDHLDVPSGGGTWTTSSKKKNLEVVAGVIRKHAGASDDIASPLSGQSALLVERLLKASHVESATLEMKQGFSRLSDPARLNAEIVNEIGRTVCAISNEGPSAKGYVLVGIADKESDADRVASLSDQPVSIVEGRWVTGLTIDETQLGSLDNTILWFTQKFEALPIQDDLRSETLRKMRVASLNGRNVLVLPVRTVGEPVPFDNDFFVRSGSQTLVVPGSEVSKIFARFKGVK